MQEIKNLRKAAKRIQDAIKNKEKIILYGDADLDGASSVILLEEAIKNLGGEIAAVYFPDREKEGYGLNKKALGYLKQFTPALLITLDCGIGNFEEIKIAQREGFEVIVVDHHEIIGHLPPASIIVDPKQKDDPYPFKQFANAGIVYKLCQVLLGKKLKGLLKDSFLELVALATIADMMPQDGENKVLILEGLEALERTLRPGLKVFWQFSEPNSSIRTIASRIISALNSAVSQEHLTESYLLLKASDQSIARKIAERLIKRNEEKHLRIQQILQEVQKRILNDLESPIIFEGDRDWPLSFAGSVASLLCRDFQKPIFIFKIGDKISRGAVRTPKDINSIKAMESCSHLLETFGGHPVASGFTIRTENLEEFKECLIKYFLKKI
ncbi:DHH family phosphoesterase [bacterium]|nr:DHH family phosphoesterase [bacterium]